VVVTFHDDESSEEEVVLVPTDVGIKEEALKHRTDVASNNIDILPARLSLPSDFAKSI